MSGGIAIDVLYDGQTFEEQTLSAAVDQAKPFVTASIAHGMSDIGDGIGPVNHFAWRHHMVHVAD